MSDGSLIIVEAKANQTFTSKQCSQLKNAKELIVDQDRCCFSDVHLVGLHSSKYYPREETAKIFNATITWEDLANIAPSFYDEFTRANDIYDD